ASSSSSCSARTCPRASPRSWTPPHEVRSPPPHPARRPGRRVRERPGGGGDRARRRACRLRRGRRDRPPLPARRVDALGRPPRARSLRCPLLRRGRDGAHPAPHLHLRAALPEPLPLREGGREPRRPLRRPLRLRGGGLRAFGAPRFGREAFLADVAELRAAGVTYLNLTRPAASRAEHVERIARFGDEVLARLS